MVGQHPLQRLLQVAKGALTAVLEHLECDQVGARGHAGVQVVGRSDQAGDVRAVAVGIAGICVVVGKVPLVDDAVGHAVAVQVTPEETVVQVDAGVDHHGGGAAPVQRGIALAQAGDAHGGECRVDGQLAVVDHRRAGGRSPGAAVGPVHLHRDQRVGGVDAHRDRVGQRLGLYPARALYFGHGVAAWQQVLEAVVAQRIGQCRAFTGVQHAVGVGVQEDRPALHAEIAGIACAVAVEVVELHPGDAAQLHVAQVGHHLQPALDCVGRGWRHALPAGLHHLPDLHRARAHAAEAEHAIRACDDAHLARIQHLVAITIQEDRPACQRLFTRIAVAVRITVVELHPGQRGRLEVAKVRPGHRVALDQAHAVAAHHSTQAQGGQQPVRRQHLRHQVVASRQTREAVAALRIGHGGQLALIEQTIAVRVQVHRAASDRILNVPRLGVVAAAAIQILEHEAFDAAGHHLGMGPADAALPNAGVACTVLDTSGRDRELVQAQRRGERAQPLDAPLVVGQRLHGHCVAEFNENAVPGQRDVFAAKLPHDLVHAQGRLHRCGPQGRRDRIDRDHAGCGGVDEDPDEAVGCDVAGCIVRAHPDVVHARALQVQLGREAAPFHHRQAQFGVGGGVRQAHPHPVFGQRAAEHEVGGVGQPVGGRLAGVRADAQRAGRQRSHGVHHPARAGLAAAGIAGGVAHAGAVHGEGVAAVQPGVPSEVGDPEPAVINALDDHLRVGQLRTLDCAHGAHDADVAPAEAAIGHRVAETHIQGPHHRVAHVGAQLLHRHNGRAGGVHAPAALGHAHPSHALRVSHAASVQAQAVCAFGLGVGRQAGEAVSPGVDGRDLYVCAQHQCLAIAHEQQVFGLQAAGIHVTRKGDFHAGHRCIAQRSRIGEIDDHRGRQPQRPAGLQGIDASVAGQILHAIGIDRQPVVAVHAKHACQACDLDLVVAQGADAQLGQAQGLAVARELQVVDADAAEFHRFAEDQHERIGRALQQALQWAAAIAFQAHQFGCAVVQHLVAQRVASRGVQVHQVQQVLGNGAALVLREAAVRAPDHAARALVHGQHLAVSAHHAHQLVAGQRVRQLQVAPAAARIGSEGALDPGAAQAGVGRQAHRRAHAVAEVQHVGRIAVVGQVVDQEVGDAVAHHTRGPGQADLQRADELVHVHALDERGAHVAEVVQLLEAGLVVGEAALQ